VRDAGVQWSRGCGHGPRRVAYELDFLDAVGDFHWPSLLPAVLVAAEAAAPSVGVVAIADDVYLQGLHAALRSAFGLLNGPGGVAAVGLALSSPKCALYGLDPAADGALAAELGVRHAPDGLVVVGSPIGPAAFQSAFVSAQADETCRSIDALEQLVLPAQSVLLLLRRSHQHRMGHLVRTVPWALCEPHVRRVERRILDAVSSLFRLPYSAVDARAQLALPLRHGGFGLQVMSARVADAAFLAAAALAQAVVQHPPFRPFNGASRGRLAPLWARVHAAGLPAAPGASCAWPAGVVGVLDDGVVRDLLPGAQRLLSRHLADAGAARFLARFGGSSADAMRGRARLLSAACRAASMWIDALPRPQLALGDADFVASGRHRLGLPMVPAFVDGLPARCHCGGDAGRGDHAMTCVQLAGLRAMRHDRVVAALRLTIGYAGLACVTEPRLTPSYLAVPAAPGPAAAGSAALGSAALGPAEPGLAAPGGAAGGVAPPASTRPAPVNARADILVVMPQTNALHVDVSVTHPAADTYVAAAAEAPGAAAATRDRRKEAHYLLRGFDHGFELVPFSLETYGRLGEPAMRFLSTLAATAAASGRVSQRAFLEGALRLVSVALCKGNGRMYTESLHGVSRAHGRAYARGARVAVPGDA
jgi:hypothetical protein